VKFYSWPLAAYHYSITQPVVSEKKEIIRVVFGQRKLSGGAMKNLFIVIVFLIGTNTAFAQDSVEERPSS
jgi:hypothetical protein